MEFLVWSAYHGMWHRPDFRGYTGILEEAGIWTREQAERFCNTGTDQPPRDYPVPAANPEAWAALLQDAYLRANDKRDGRRISMLIQLARPS